MKITEFKRGDIIYDVYNKTIFIYDGCEIPGPGLMISSEECIIYFIVLINSEEELTFSGLGTIHDFSDHRFRIADKEQRKKIFDKLREIGKTYVCGSHSVSNIAKREFCFHAFDEVLVRNIGGCWHIGIYEYYKHGPAPFKCMTEQWEECVPFNSETENLLLIKEEAPEKYKKLWEEMKLYYLGL